MKIGNLNIGNIPRVISVIHGVDVIKLAKLSSENAADLIEIRIDQLDHIDESSIQKTLEKVRTVSNLPIVGTIRSEKESDTAYNKYNYNLSSSQRLDLYKKIIPFCDAVDIEFHSNKINDDIIKYAHENNKKIIMSYHNFAETPPDRELYKIINDSFNKKADIVKIASFANKRNDVVRLMNITSEISSNQSIISISLGSIGSISRLMAPLFGSCITYGYISGRPMAKGQLNIVELQQYLKLFYSNYNDFINKQQLLEAI